MAVRADAAACGPVPPGRTCKRQWTVPLPAVQRGVAEGLDDPAAVAGVRSAGHACGLPVSASRGRCPRVRTVGVRRRRRPGPQPQQVSTEPDTAAGSAVRLRVRPGCWPDGRCPPRTPPPRAVSGWRWHWTLRQGPLSAAASGTAVGVRTASVHRGHCEQPGYRQRSPARRPLEGCRHRRSARASWPWSRSPSWART